MKLAVTPYVLLFKGQSQYNSVNGMVDAFERAFSDAGFDCLTPNVLDQEDMERVRNLITEDRVSMIFSLNGYGIPQQAGTYFDKIDIPVFIYFVDHPIFHSQRILAPVRNLFMSFPTSHHVDFCRMFFGDVLNVTHIPHAAETGTCGDWNDRDIPLFFSGTPMMGATNEEWSQWCRETPERLKNVHAMIAAHKESPGRPLELIIADQLDVQPPWDGEGRIAILTYFEKIDFYLRSLVKWETVSALRNLPLSVCGEGWETLDGAGDDWNVLGWVSAEETLNRMSRAKITLNLLPPYYESHERVFQAMANGSVPATTPAGLWDDLFAAGEPDACLLSLPYDSADAAGFLTEALADDDRLREISKRGYEASKSSHTWRHRVDSILEFMRSHGRAPEPR